MASNGVSGPHGRDITATEAVSLQGKPDIYAEGPAFSDVLDALNPVQYLPVVGTIYRVVTGDDGNPALRTVASLASGFAFGGPLGLLTSIASNLAERAFHLEHFAHDLLGFGEQRSPNSTAAQAASAYQRASAMTFGGPR